jgi:hypothetical protein
LNPQEEAAVVLVQVLAHAIMVPQVVQAGVMVLITQVQVVLEINLMPHQTVVMVLLQTLFKEIMVVLGEDHKLKVQEVVEAVHNQQVATVLIPQLRGQKKELVEMVEMEHLLLLQELL